MKTRPIIVILFCAILLSGCGSSDSSLYISEGNDTPSCILKNLHRVHTDKAAELLSDACHIIYEENRSEVTVIENLDEFENTVSLIEKRYIKGPYPYFAVDADIEDLINRGCIESPKFSPPKGFTQVLVTVDEYKEMKENNCL